MPRMRIAVDGPQIQPITDGEVRRIKKQERPCRDQPANIAKHDRGADGGGSSGVEDDVGGYVGVAESAECEAAAGDEEGGCVSHLWDRRGEEHDVACHD